MLAQDWQARMVCVLAEPGQRPLGPDGADLPAGYLPPGAAPLPDMAALDLRYWLKPPQDPEHDDPLLVDTVRFGSLNIFQE